MTTFLKDTALFCWQQYQRKIEDQTNVSISWEGFKAFFCQSLGKSEVFVICQSDNLIGGRIDWFIKRVGIAWSK